MTRKIGIIGSGVVGKTLAKGFISHEYEVMIGTREPKNLQEWQKTELPTVKIGTFAETAAFGATIVLAVKGTVAKEALQMVGAEHLANKTIIDTTNPIADEPPTNGVLSFFTTLKHSLMEELQQTFTTSHFVKAFSCVGNHFMVNPNFAGVKPTMFICGNDANSKKDVAHILHQFGWEIEDMGNVEAARAIEPLCMLWCIPGLKENRWNHAFKLLVAS